MDNEQLEIIYLPYQNKVVILSADLPYEPEEISEKHELDFKRKSYVTGNTDIGNKYYN